MNRGVKGREKRLQYLRTNHFDVLFDVLVIGGGATGCGIALQASAKGFKTLLIDSGDFAQSTSSKSTKILHGGVRYLAQGDIDLVYHALRERNRLIHNAPHLCESLSYIVPVKSFWQWCFYGIGLWLYSLLSGKYALGRTTLFFKKRLMRDYPALKEEGLFGGIRYFDAKFDDARLVITTIQTFESLGGIALNYLKLDDLIKDDQGDLIGAKLSDQISKEQFSIKAKAIFNATGSFADRIRLIDNPQIPKRIMTSQGSHIILPKTFNNHSPYAMLIPKTGDGRVLFVIPWHQVLIVGTTDVPKPTPDIEAISSDEEIDFILESFNQYMGKKASKKDILATYSGQRPLVITDLSSQQNTKKLSRDHIIEISRSHLISVMGGKWTTYRLMGEEAIRKAIQSSLLPAKEGDTKTLKLIGYTKTHLANGFDRVYGTQIDIIKAMKGYDERLHKDFCYTKAHVRYAIEYEYAISIEDIIARRWRLLYLDAKVALAIAPKVATILKAYFDIDIKCAIKQFNTYAKNYIR